MSNAILQSNCESIDKGDASVPPHPIDNMAWLPCTMSIQVPIVGFTVADLLTLGQGTVLKTAVHHTSDLPLRVNGVLVAWGEFDAVNGKLAVRFTESA